MPSPSQPCPVCGEARSRGDECAACHCDLGQLTDIERNAERLRQRARYDYGRGRYRSAATHAARLTELQATAEDLKLLACAQLLAGDFPAALETSRRMPRSRCGAQ